MRLLFAPPQMHAISPIADAAPFLTWDAPLPGLQSVLTFCTVMYIFIHLRKFGVQSSMCNQRFEFTRVATRTTAEDPALRRDAAIKPGRKRTEHAPDHL